MRVNWNSGRKSKRFQLSRTASRAKSLTHEATLKPCGNRQKQAKKNIQKQSCSQREAAALRAEIWSAALCAALDGPPGVAAAGCHRSGGWAGDWDCGAPVWRTPAVRR